ncbi:MAG: hypothetical protein GQ529_06955 [Methyloprofundus sp.]|nr:hypothetical protein [Methyloprofundus sp.]
METAILYLSPESFPPETHFDDIHYSQAVTYANKFGSITHTNGEYIEFNVIIDNKQFSVTLDKASGEGVKLSSKHICTIRTMTVM